MHTLGHTFMPAPMHAGGLRYHGMAPLICKLYDEGVIEARAVPQIATFQAAVQFARAEGILPAPEAAHAVRGAIDEALMAQEGRQAEDHRLQPLRATASSTSPPTRPTWPASSRTTSTPPRRWRRRSGTCPR